MSLTSSSTFEAQGQSACNDVHTPPKSMSLYVHIPFCETKCPYCDFNTYERIEPLIPAYVKALRNEIFLWGEFLGHPEIKTIFFGGGTPSYLGDKHIYSVMQIIRSVFEVPRTTEVTLEANPGDITPLKLATYLDMGVNRLSIGIQSFSDRLLETLGRRHTVADAINAYQMTLEAGFSNISIDLIYGLPYQNISDWEKTLNTTTDLDPVHVSMYSLILEEGTPMAQSVHLGNMPEPDQDLAADMYLLAQEEMKRHRYTHYEISNWAKPGFQSLHNRIYWRGQAYLGVGPGAHSYLPPFRFFNIKSPREYARRLRHIDLTTSGTRNLTCSGLASHPVIEEVEYIDRKLEMAETLMMGLRLNEGINVSEFYERFDITPYQAYQEVISELLSLGLLKYYKGYLRLTHKGRMLGNEVFGRFF